MITAPKLARCARLVFPPSREERSCSRFMYLGPFDASRWNIRSLFRDLRSSTKARTFPSWLGYRDHSIHLASIRSKTSRPTHSTKLNSFAMSSLTPPTPALADFLQNQKTRYLKDVDEGKGGNWTVVMGNEAGGRSSILCVTRPPLMHE